MAKIVIAGSANCPYFARAELLADSLQTKLPYFKIHKIVKNPDEWEGWLSDTCQQNGWMHSSSPVIWRELINRGGKGVLIGGSNEFQEYAAGYYGITSGMLSSDMTTISSENMETHQSVVEEAKYIKSLSKPLRVCFTNASSPVVHHMLQEVASGDVLGRDEELGFRLLVQEGKLEAARGVCLEVVDMAHPLLRNVSVTAVAEEALADANLIIISDELPRMESETWEAWMKRCASLYMEYGSVINKCASPECKVVVAGKGPLNLGAYLIKQEASYLQRQNIVVSSRLPENRAKSAIARRIKVNSSGVVNIIVWGNCGGKTHLDLANSSVHGCEGAIWGPPFYSRSVKDMVHDDRWLQTEYLQSLDSYEETLQGALGHASSISAAHSVVSTIKDWWNGSTGSEIYSMGVISDGCFGIPEGLVFSLPVKLSKGRWSVMEDVAVNEDLEEQLSRIVQELQQEIRVIFPSSSADVAADQVCGGDEEQTGNPVTERGEGG